MNKKITENDLYAKLRKEREELYKIIGSFTMKRLERKQEKERLERQIHQQMLKEQESLMKELRTMLPEAAESFSSERIVCLCHVVDLWACIVALFEAPTPLSISKLRRLADSDMPLILLSSEIMEKESDFRIIEL